MFLPVTIVSFWIQSDLVNQWRVPSWYVNMYSENRFNQLSIQLFSCAIQNNGPKRTDALLQRTAIRCVSLSFNFLPLPPHLLSEHENTLTQRPYSASTAVSSIFHILWGFWRISGCFFSTCFNASTSMLTCVKWSASNRVAVVFSLLRNFIDAFRARNARIASSDGNWLLNVVRPSLTILLCMCFISGTVAANSFSAAFLILSQINCCSFLDTTGFLPVWWFSGSSSFSSVLLLSFRYALFMLYAMVLVISYFWARSTILVLNEFCTTAL